MRPTPARRDPAPIPVEAPDDADPVIAGLRLSLLQAGHRLGELRMDLGRAEQDRDRAREDVRAATLRAQNAIEALDAVQTLPDRDALLQGIAQRDAEIANQARHLEAFRSSAVWRASWPLRRLLARHPLLARFGRRMLRGVWWTLTLQWPDRLRARAIPAAAMPPEPAPAGIGLGSDTAPEPPLPVLPDPAAPVVSVIVPAFGQVPATLRCLAAIAASDTRTPFEVLVAEDASGDPAVALLERVAGLRLLRRTRNLGFLHNCNDAALHARGRFLLFLNNDTEPMPGFLDALVQLADARPDAGLVGAKLLFPDGRLQEAGGIVWQDGTGWNYGRGDDPMLPQYCTVRDTDYVSGAAILLRRELFEQLGGFDPMFAPAYYEDTDLAFRIRARGLRVLLQPASLVVHHEGLSHGTDTAAGIKAHQETNRHRFVGRWPRLLAAEHLPSGDDPWRAAAHARGAPFILVIDHYVPEPDRDAGSRSTLAILRALRDANWLVAFWPQNRARNDYTVLLETMGVTVLDGRLPMGFAQWIASHGSALDHVLVMRPTVAPEFLSALLCHTAARLGFYGHDVHHLRMRRQAALDGDAALAAEANAMERMERRLWGAFDVSLYPSETEAALVRRLVPGARARAIPLLCFDRFRSAGTAPAAPVILFVAGFAHPPNIDAALWLADAILPLVLAAVPDARLVLAGSHPGAAVRALADGRIRVTGSLDEEALHGEYRAARVAVVPLRVGAGVKGKVIEAMQQAVPLVTTPIGAEGIAGIEQVVAVGEDAAGLAAALVALLRDDALWQRQAVAQTAFVSARFSREAFSSGLLAALGD